MAQLKPSPAARPDEALQLSLDDFSARVASTEDPIFWVRVERYHADAIVVTDFHPGDRPLAELEAALAMAVRAVSGPRPRTLVFKDLVPGGDQQPGFSIRIVRQADLAKTLANALAAGIGATVTGFRFASRAGGKLDAVLTLG